MKQIKKSSVATALGAVVIGSLASTVALADTNPFGMQSLVRRRQVRRRQKS